ncbi:MAG TPA: DUF72 domain-containing protein [Dongiaceae bacterium]|nr:DUF72 domain-containing protein [Dongiaceae bacterium]
MTLTRQDLAQRAASLAAQGVYVGTSSWKYPGWCGTVYDRARYEYRGKFAKTRFKRDCLAEYAEVFKTVCVDAAYCNFPSQPYLEGMVGQTPDDFVFGLKVTDAITIKKYPNLDRFGHQAGKPNANFLNAELFVKAFLKPCEAMHHAIGLLMFEFSRFLPTDYEHGRDFIAELDKFLGQLPKGWPYGVEMRNRGWLKPEYSRCLARHEVTHVFNSWDELAHDHRKPVIHISREGGGAASPERDLLRFIHDNKINVLNVAGPRASEEPEVAAFAKAALDKVWPAP